MSITFACGNCGRTLTTSEDRAGQQAKCPGCGEVVTVPQPTAPEPLVEDDLLTEDGDEPSADKTELAAEKSSATRACPMCGMENPRTARKCQACGEAFPGTPKRDRRANTSLEVGNMISSTWDIFKEHLAVTVVSTLILTIPMVVWIYATMGCGFIALSQLDAQEQVPLFALFIAGPISALSFLAMAFLGPGYSRLMLAVARGDDVSLATLLSGGKFVLRNLLASIAFFTCVWFGTMACLVPGVLVALIWWAYSYILVDEDAPGLSCLGRSRAIMQDRWSDVFLVLLVGHLINYGVSSFCCIAGMFSQAFLALLTAVTYVRLTGQLTALEKPLAQADDAGIDE